MSQRKRRRAAAATQQRAFKRGRYQKFKGRLALAELKFIDVTYDNAPVTTGGLIESSINIIAQGITESTRIGRKCTITNIGWRYDVALPERDAAATPETGDVLRLILYQDKQTNGASATVVNILQVANYQSFNNLSNKGRFTILMDKTHSINYMNMASDGAAVVSLSSVVRSYTFFKKCNIGIEYDDTAATGALTTIRTNNIGILAISRSGVVQIASQICLRFSDG